jgi:hypothetical protein
MRFKQGDVITAIYKGRGLEEATVMDVVEKDGKQYYSLKIVRGTALLPVAAEVNYKIFKKK